MHLSVEETNQNRTSEFTFTNINESKHLRFREICSLFMFYVGSRYSGVFCTDKTIFIGDTVHYIINDTYMIQNSLIANMSYIHSYNEVLFLLQILEP